jgi:catechol 2,3-dioxygenase-like lactoylglutathione lyase family enzyme
MIQSSVGHLVFAINAANAGFYKNLLTFLGWNAIFEHEGSAGFSDASKTSLWFMAGAKPIGNDYDGPGLNHFALAVPKQVDVDTAAKYLADRGVKHLFETPRHRPDFVSDPSQTYYQVMFESPDRILFEIVYTGPKE